MPLKKNATGNRFCRDGTGTHRHTGAGMAGHGDGQGYAAWFIPADIDERVGGDITFHFMPGVTSSGKVTIWDPPHRVGYEEYNWGGGRRRWRRRSPLRPERAESARCAWSTAFLLQGTTGTTRWRASRRAGRASSVSCGSIWKILPANIPLRARCAVIPMRAQEKHGRSCQTPLVSQAQRLVIPKASRRMAGGSSARLSTMPSGWSRTRSCFVSSKPRSGVANIGSYQWGGQTHVAVQLILYGDDADSVLTGEAPHRERWMMAHFPSVSPSQTS